MKIRSTHIIILILLIIIFFSTRSCNYNRDRAIDFKGKYDYLAGQTVDSFKNKDGKKVLEQKPIVFSDDKELRIKSDEIFNLKNKNERLIKKINTLVSVTQGVKIITDVIPYDSSDYVNIPDGTKINRDSVIFPPKKFRNTTKDYTIAGTVLLRGVKIDSITLQNIITFQETTNKNTIFGKRYTNIQAINSNPLFTNSYMNSMTVKHQTNAWNRTIKPILAFAAGVYITTKLKK